MSNTKLAKSDGGQVIAAATQLDALRQIAEQATPADSIRWRAGRGGSKLPYTDGPYVIRTLNAAFGWDWDFQADNEELLFNGERPFEVKVRGTLTVRLSGQAVVKTQFGSQPIEFLKDGSAPVSIGDAFKGAATDAMKKCASLLGIALDLYDSDSPIHKSNGGTKQQQQNSPPPARPGITNGKPPKLPGKAGQIQSLAEFLGWGEGTLCEAICQALGIKVASDSVSVLESLDDQQLAQVAQLLDTERKQRVKAQGGKP